MSRMTDDSQDERSAGRTQSGRHLKTSGAHSRPRRTQLELSEDDALTIESETEEEAPRRRPRAAEEEPRRVRSDSGEEQPRRTRSVPEEEAPRRQRRAPEEEAPRREHSRPQAKPVPKRGRKKKKRRTGLKILIVVLAVLLALALAGYFVFMHFYGMLNTSGSKVSPTPMATSTTQASAEPTAFVPPTPLPEEEPTPTPEPLSEEELARQAELELMASLQEEAEEVMFDEDVYNILLIGTDGLGNVMERSDSMNLLSINKATGDIWVTSFMRDTQVTIPNWGLAHLNWATTIGNSADNPYGGINTLIATLESGKNFAIHIDSWAMVNFLDFVKVANLLGPITVSVTAAEAENMNQNIRQVCQMIDASEGRAINAEGNIPRYYFPLDVDGTYTITDGAQILGYCRERKVGGDTGRSQKQREVIMQMMENVKNMTLGEQYELAKTILPIITTNLTAGQCFSLLLQLPSIKDYSIHSQQCPVIGAFWKGRDDNNLSIYNADFAVNRNFLRATIYGEHLTKGELTSSWTGERVLVYWNEEWDQ